MPTPRRWWIHAVLGAAALAAGLLVLLFPDRTVGLLAAAAGAYLVLVGLLRLSTAATTDKGRLVEAVLGLAALAGAALVLFQPGRALTAISIGFGVYLVLAGLLGLVVVMRARLGGGAVALCLLDVVAGVAAFSWPRTTLLILVLVLGLYLVVRGVAELATGLVLRGAAAQYRTEAR